MLWLPLTFSMNLQAGEVDIFVKCYSLFTEKRPSLDHPLLKAIINKEKNGLESCSELLKESALNKEGILINQSRESRDILRTFQALHNSWFSSHMIYMPDDSPLLFDLVEFEEPALFITRSLFKKDVPYASVLQGHEALRGKRKSLLKPDYLLKVSQEKYSPIPMQVETKSSKSERVTWKPTLLERGDLYGIIQSEKGRNILPAHADDLFYPRYFKEPLDLDANGGGGLLGSNTYLLLNLGRAHGALSDGRVIQMRNWSKQVIRDLMCRELPVITPSDASAFLNPKAKLSWSGNKNCMGCHATIDTMAGLVRNAQVILSEADEDTSSSHVKFFKTDHRKIGLYDKVENYHQSLPDGRFVYRDRSGHFYNQYVGNLDQLGKAMAQTRDFYLCAGQRYFEFLTGEKVTDLKGKKGRFLKGLAINLKRHQSLRRVIMEIIQSPWFM